MTENQILIFVVLGILSVWGLFSQFGLFRWLGWLA